MNGFGGLSVVLWAASGLPILLAPFCQVRLHRSLSSSADHPPAVRRLAAYNHVAVLAAACLWAVHIASVEPGATLLATALLALPAAAVTVLLWLILAIRCRRSLES